MFIGTDKEIHRAATQQLYQAAIHLRRASDALLAVQPILEKYDFKEDVRVDRQHIEKMAERYDLMFQRAAAEAFSA